MDANYFKLCLHKMCLVSALGARYKLYYSIKYVSVILWVKTATSVFITIYLLFSPVVPCASFL